MSSNNNNNDDGCNMLSSTIASYVFRHPWFVLNDKTAISKEDAIEYLNRHTMRFVALKDDPECLKKAGGDITKVPLSEYRHISQDHPDWAKLRKNPSLWPASLIAQYLHIHCREYEKELDLGPSMLSDNTEVNIEWVLRIFRAWATKTPGIPPVPGIQVHANMGLFCEFGKKHEANDIVVFMVNNPQFVYHESGLVVMSQKMFEDLQLINPLTSMPFDWQKDICDVIGIIGASPDGILTVTEAGVIVERSILECKCATPFIPNPEPGSMPGIDTKPVPNRKPYKNIKGYYLFQFMIQMVVCEVTHGYWSVYTQNRGQRVWRCGISKPLLAMMFALLNFMCKEIKKDGLHDDPKRSYDSPILKFGYFKSLSCPKRIADLHERMINLVCDITKCRNGNSLCSPHATYMNVDKITRNVLGIDETEQYPIPYNYRLPYSYPPEVQSFVLLVMYCRAFELTTEFSEWYAKDADNIIPVAMSTSVRDRRHNVRCMLRLVQGFSDFLSDSVEYILNDGEGITDQTYLTFVTVRSRRVENAENLVNFFVSLYFQAVCESKSSVKVLENGQGATTTVTLGALKETINEKLKTVFLSALSLLVKSDEFVSTEFFIYMICRAPITSVYCIDKEKRTVSRQQQSSVSDPAVDMTTPFMLRRMIGTLDRLVGMVESGIISDERVNENEIAHGLPLRVLVAQLDSMPSVSRIFPFAVYSVFYYVMLAIVGSNTVHHHQRDHMDIEMCYK